MTDHYALVVCVDSVFLGFGTPSMEVLLFGSEQQAVDYAVDLLVRYGLYEAFEDGSFTSLAGDLFTDKGEVLDDFDARLDSSEYFRVIECKRPAV